MTNSVMGKQMWILEPYIPLRTEHENQTQWRVAGKRAHVQPALRLSLLSQKAGNMPGHYDVEETYLIPLDKVDASTRPCLFCGSQVKDSELSAMGFTYHQRCLAGEISLTKAEELKLIALPIRQLKNWIDLAPL